MPCCTGDYLQNSNISICLILKSHLYRIGTLRPSPNHPHGILRSHKNGKEPCFSCLITINKDIPLLKLRLTTRLYVLHAGTRIKRSVPTCRI